MTALALALVLAQFEPPVLRILDEGAAKGSASALNCTGAGVTCSVAGSRATINVTGGGGGSPGGSSGDLQTNNGAGGFGGYAGAGPCLSGQFFTALSSAGSPSCAAPGADGQIIFRSSGALTSSSTLTWDGNTLGIGSPVSLPHNPIAVQGNGNFWYQINIQNTSAGNSASSDYVATADSGNDSINYIDMGINSSGYNDSAYTIGGVLAGYLYTNGGDLTIGTQTAAKVLKFHTGGTLASHLRVTIGDGALNLAPGVQLQMNGSPFNFTHLAGSASAAQLPAPAVGAKGGIEAKTCSGTDKVSAIGADGVPVCTADQSAGYTLPAATATVLGGVKGTGSALLCSGSDKVTGFAADGTMQCATDQTTGGGGGGNFVRAVVDFGTGDTLVTTTVSASWVTSSSKIVCSVDLSQATTNRAAGEEDALLEGIVVAPANLNAGVGFDLVAHAPSDATGQFSVNCGG